MRPDLPAPGAPSGRPLPDPAAGCPTGQAACCEHAHAPAQDVCRSGRAHDGGHGSEPGDGCRPLQGCGQEHAHGDAGPDPAAGGRPARVPLAPGEVRSRLRIGQMDCPTEETLIRRKLGAMPEVRALEFNLMQRTLTVVHPAGAEARIGTALRELGMTPEPLADDAGTVPAPAAAGHGPAWLLALAGALAALSEAAHFAQWPAWASALPAAAAILACGLGTYRKGWIAVRHGNLNINALMSLAVTGAVLIGQWPEAAMVMFLFNVAERIEARSLDRARNAVRGLLDLAPQTATAQRPDGSWASVPVAELVPGDLVRVRPGERIGADGVLTAGHSSVDQAAITGESLPVEKAAQDPVYAGTVNAEGSFEYRVTAAAGQTTLARIIHAVEQAQASRAPTQRFIDRFSRVYTPAVVALAAATAAGLPLITDMGWMDAAYRALALLIIACPCALVVSTPVTLVSGLTAASRRGILVKGGAYLEAGRRLRRLALDKTGTLTEGRPARTDFETWAGAPASPDPARLAASLAGRSDHPVSQALAQAAREEGRTPLAVEDFAALPGQGVRGRIAGADYYLGNRRMLRTLGVEAGGLDARLDALENAGKSAVVLTDGKRPLALAAVADAVRPDSRDAVADLHRLGIRTLMLTGDNRHVARAVADQVGIDEVAAELLPQDKLAAVEAAAMQGGIGMVGDGINDAPALARADIGFAMGAAGTGTAIETADVALMDDDLRKIGTFVRLSRATHRVLWQNIGLALVIKAIFLALAVAGQATLWMAVFADVGASLLVVANGLRLLRRGRASPAGGPLPAAERGAAAA